MADIRENQMTKITPINVRCVDSTGNSGIATPTEVVRYFSGNSGAYSDNDLNNATNTGIYIANFDTKNKPINDYGIVEVIKVNSYIIQKFHALNDNAGYLRKSVDGSPFKNWIKVY